MKTKNKFKLTINNNMYISCDKRNWILYDKEVPFLFAPTRDDLLHALVNYKIRYPADFNNLLERIETIHKLIDTRIPKGLKPKDLFGSDIDE